MDICITRKNGWLRRDYSTCSLACVQTSPRFFSEGGRTSVHRLLADLLLPASSIILWLKRFFYSLQTVTHQLRSVTAGPLRIEPNHLPLVVLCLQPLQTLLQFRKRVTLRKANVCCQKPKKERRKIIAFTNQPKSRKGGVEVFQTEAVTLFHTQDIDFHVDIHAVTY